MSRVFLNIFRFLGCFSPFHMNTQIATFFDPSFEQNANIKIIPKSTQSRLFEAFFCSENFGMKKHSFYLYIMYIGNISGVRSNSKSSARASVGCEAYRAWWQDPRSRPHIPQSRSTAPCKGREARFWRAAKARNRGHHIAYEPHGRNAWMRV